MKVYLSCRRMEAGLLFFCMLAIVGIWCNTAVAATVCRPGTEATCKPADAVDAAADYLYYLKKSVQGRVEVDALHELFTADVRKKLSRNKFAGMLDEFFGSSFSVTAYTVDSKVVPLDTGEVVCRASIHYIVYISGMLTSRSVNAVFHVRFEEGEWRLSRAPSYAGGFNYQGMFP